jgi:hypothetical protein
MGNARAGNPHLQVAVYRLTPKNKKPALLPSHDTSIGRHVLLTIHALCCALYWPHRTHIAGPQKPHPNPCTARFVILAEGDVLIKKKYPLKPKLDLALVDEESCKNVTRIPRDEPHESRRGKNRWIDHPIGRKRPTTFCGWWGK